MARISAGKVRKEWAQVLDRVCHKGERILVDRHGKKACALVSWEDYQLLERLEDRLDLEEARAALAEVRKKGTVPWAKIKAAAGL